MQQTRADSKMTSKAATALLDKWTSIPDVLLSQCLAMLMDARALVAVHCCCKLWNKATLNRAWKLVFCTDYEPESGDDPCIAAGGQETTWKQRFAARLRLEQNWAAGRMKLQTFRFDSSPVVKLINRLGLLACCVSDDLILREASGGKEVRRWSLHSCLEYSECLAIDQDHSPPLIATATESAGIAVWDSVTGKQHGVAFNLDFVTCIDVCAPYVVAANGSVSIFEVATGQPVQKLNVGGMESIHLVHSRALGEWLMFDEGKNALRCWNTGLSSSAPALSKAPEPELLVFRVRPSRTNVCVDKQRARLLVDATNRPMIWQPDPSKPGPDRSHEVVFLPRFALYQKTQRLALRLGGRQMLFLAGKPALSVYAVDSLTTWQAEPLPFEFVCGLDHGQLAGVELTSAHASHRFLVLLDFRREYSNQVVVCDFASS